MRACSQAKIGSHCCWELQEDTDIVTTQPGLYCTYLYYGAVSDEVANAAATDGVEEAGISGVSTVVDLSRSRSLTAMAAT